MLNSLELTVAELEKEYTYNELTLFCNDKEAWLVVDSKNCGKYKIVSAYKKIILGIGPTKDLPCYKNEEMKCTRRYENNIDICIGRECENTYGAIHDRNMIIAQKIN